MTASDPAGPGTAAVAALEELRVLEGPNLYFPRPAVKLTLSVDGLVEMPSAQAAALARRLGVRVAQPGDPGTGHRQRLAGRVVARVVRRVAAAAGTTRLGLRVRAGAEPREVVVAYPWQHRGRAVALGEAVAEVMAGLHTGETDLLVTTAAHRVRTADPGSPPALVRPHVPVASVTGTNGKTSTTRLLAHIAMTAGKHTAWSSTDGVVVMGETVEPGDYSGPAGARLVLQTPGLELGILETARGGLLLKGMGVPANDVSVVTNVSADHLGLMGIDTLDQLAEVKSIITKVTRASGWCVLNGDDPRVLAMRSGTRAKPWIFSMDPTSPALREAVDSGGRAATVLDGDLVVYGGDLEPDHLVAVLDVPMTLSGLSEHNVANALAATAAALGLGLPREAVVEGLRTFRPDPTHNPGRMNVWSVPVEGGSATVVVDLAHNEAGLDALAGVCDGLRAPGGFVRLGLGTAGDRTDDILRALGEIAGVRADRVAVVHKEHYLRGRTTEDLEHHLRLGLAAVGVHDVPSYPDELTGLQALVAEAGAGDVVAVMCHSDRPLLDAWLTSVGGTPDGPLDIRRKVVVARGEHHEEAAIAAAWERAPGERGAALTALLEAHPDDPRLVHEWAAHLDAAGEEEAAVPVYERALSLGLREPYRHRAQIQLASSLRVLRRTREALDLLEDVAAHRPGSAAVAGFRALALRDAGRGDEAVALLLEALLAHSGDPDDEHYRAALARYAAELG